MIRFRKNKRQKQNKTQKQQNKPMEVCSMVAQYKVSHSTVEMI